MKNSTLFPMALAGIIPALWLCGCATPEESKSTTLPADANLLQGAISAQDIRTMATGMSPAILSLPEISGRQSLCRIKLAPVKNRSRFFIDCDVLMRRLTLELNRYGRDRIRFLSNNGNVQQSRAEISVDRDRSQLHEKLKTLAGEIAAAPVFAGQKDPVKVAVIPVLNTNLVNLNADSFTAMLRSEVASASGGKIQFLMPGVTEGADYYLTGQFFPESMKKEGIVNLIDYVEIADARAKSGLPMYDVDTAVSVGFSPVGGGVSMVSTKESYLLEILRNPEFRKPANVDINLNVMIVKPATMSAVFEKMLRLNRRITDNSGSADYILSCEISGLSQRQNGVAADYLLFTFQLTDPESNEVIWEDAYEVQRVSQAGIEYR